MNRRKRIMAFSLIEAILVTGLSSGVMLVVHKLVSHAYPVQARKRLEVESLRNGTVFLDRVIGQCQQARRVLNGANGDPIAGNLNLAATPLILAYNQGNGNLVHQQLRLESAAAEIRGQRFDHSYLWNEPASWVPLPGENSPKVLLKDVVSFQVRSLEEQDVNILEFSLQLRGYSRQLSARVAQL